MSEEFRSPKPWPTEPRLIPTPDGGAIVHLPVGQLGLCVGEFEVEMHDATHEEWAPLALSGFPDINGAWVAVCDEHCDPHAEHRSVNRSTVNEEGASHE